MFKFLQEKSFRSVRHAGEYLDYLFMRRKRRMRLCRW